MSNDDYYELVLTPAAVDKMRLLAQVKFGVPLTDLTHEQAMALIMATISARPGFALDALDRIAGARHLMTALGHGRINGALRPLRLTPEPTTWQRLFRRHPKLLASWS